MQLRSFALRAVAILSGLLVLLALLGFAGLRLLDKSSGTILSSGQQREYLLYVPKSYESAKPTPLVISLHGAALWPALQMKISGWNRLADTAGFIVAYPSASGFPKIWHVDRVPGLATDVRFIADLIDTLEARYNIDRNRIYVNGMSNGGGMAFVLSCTLSDRIAAIGMVSAAQSLAWDWCTDPAPIPLISFHGTADPIIPYAGGPSSAGPAATFPSVAGWAGNWARRNGCAAQATTSTVAPDVSNIRYDGCRDGATVTLYTIHGGGHSWPGGAVFPEMLVGTTSHAIDATALMWAFFSEHPLAPERAIEKRPAVP
jgi:polyhydroxybutyrate depolymerase